jgi:hypothetical protein
MMVFWKKGKKLLCTYNVTAEIKQADYVDEPVNMN